MTLTHDGKLRLSTFERIFAIGASLIAVVTPTYTMAYYFGQLTEKVDTVISTENLYTAQTNENTTQIAVCCTEKDYSSIK